MLYTTLSGLKQQLNIEPTYTTDDTILATILNASEQAVINYLNPFVTGLTTGITLNLSGTTVNVNMSGYTKSHTTVSIAVVQATYLLAAHLYTNRQIVSFTQGVEIPFTYRFLLDPYKNFVIC
jgi:hypothetical protein